MKETTTPVLTSPAQEGVGAAPALLSSSLPEVLHAFEREATRGMGSTGIRAGIVKTAVNPKATPLTEIERKIAQATAQRQAALNA